MANTNTNLNAYKVFCEVARAGSYAKASQTLYLTTQSISASIKKLEETLNVQLFYRELDGVKLTKAGEAMFEGISIGINYIELAEKLAMQQNDLDVSEITIGCQSHLVTYYLLDHIVKAKKDYPNLHINIISDASSNEMLKLLERHKIDFIIDVVPVDNNKYKNIIMEKLHTLKMIFISKEPIIITDLKQLENLKYILNFDNTITTSKLKETLEKYNIKIQADLKEDITETRIAMVKKNLGISYVIKEAVKEELENNELYEIEIPIDLPEQQLNLIYIKDTLTNADKKFIKKYLKE